MDKLVQLTSTMFMYLSRGHKLLPGIKLIPLVLLMASASVLAHPNSKSYQQVVREAQNLRFVSKVFLKTTREEIGDQPLTWEAIRFQKQAKYFHRTFTKFSVFHRHRLMSELRVDFQKLAISYKQLQRSLKRIKNSSRNSRMVKGYRLLAKKYKYLHRSVKIQLSQVDKHDHGLSEESYVKYFNGNSLNYSD